MKISLLFLTLFLIAGNLLSQINTADKIYKMWDDQPCPNTGHDYSIIKARGYPYDEDWETKSYPIGNGYMGANLFGRTDIDRIQITEKTLSNEGLYGLGGMTNFAEIYLDFNHDMPQNYSRTLNLNDALFEVKYNCEGVVFTREYFMSYPDNVMVVKLSANKEGAVSFTLRPEIPYLRDSTEKNSRSGEIIAKDDLITMSGFINHFSVNYEAQIKVINEGGTLYAENGTIKVTDANSVILIVATGTNYKLSEQIFLEQNDNEKLDASVSPHQNVSKLIENAAVKGFKKLKATHLADYHNLFSRVRIDFKNEVPKMTTKALLEKYKAGNTNTYLEELMFQYGRYLLIASSRKGTLPTGLQGIWSQYEVTPFTGGYWHNINVQMNYWGAFNTNLTETFTPYIEYFQAFLPEATNTATRYIQEHNSAALSDDKHGNGWAIGTGATAYVVKGPGGHSGPGTAGFTSKLFWDYYEYTRDTTFLREIGYPVLLETSRFLSKTVKPEEDGLLLVNPSASPEQKVNGENYITKGTTFDQGFVWENHNDLLKASAILNTKDDLLDLVKDQITKLDPIIIGESGQIKEFREEEYYGDLGQKNHRHVSHLCPLYPGTLINSKTKSWMDATIVSLDLRGNNTTGWAMAHRMNLRARTKDGEKAHEVFMKLIKERTYNNLWTTHPPFQIDANFGCMAGVAEMLLQSHEGYIEPLAALPAQWTDGEYDGLVARGNFVLSAVWKDGQASSFKITSRSGGEVCIKYAGVSQVSLKDSSGKKIKYQVESQDVMRFDTHKGDTYSIVF